MLGFILSKINLLILVVSIFAIVSFFTFSLIDIIKVYQGRLLLDQISNKAFALTSSPAYCFSDSFDIPRSISIGGEEFFYIIKISKEEITTAGTGENISIVIFSMIPRVQYLRWVHGEVAEEPPSVAASAFRTNASINLFSRRYDGDTYAPADTTDGPSGSIFVDPNTSTPFNTIEFRKEVRLGEQFVYFFPCSTVGAENCQDIKTDVACLALEENQLAGLNPPCNIDSLVVDFQC